MNEPARVNRVVVALDKFKGSASAEDAVDTVVSAIHSLRPDIELVGCPIADGGEGTLDIVLRAGFTEVNATAMGPLMDPRPARYGRRDRAAFVELAEVAGLSCLPGAVGTPESALASTTFGVGQLIAQAVAEGADEITLAVGGSASTDGGAGAIAALGGLLLSDDGSPVAPGGVNLRDIARIDLTALDRLRDVSFTLAADVDNPLTGPLSAAAVYSAQKGAGPTEIGDLSAGLNHWADVVGEATGEDHRMASGAGAAGGIGFAAIALLNANVRPGIDVVLELADFDDKLDADTMVVIGEGSLDAQSLHGKGPIGVARRAAAVGARVVAVVGRCDLSPDVLRANGINAVYSLQDLEPDLNRSMSRAHDLLAAIAARIVADGAFDPQPTATRMLSSDGLPSGS